MKNPARPFPSSKRLVIAKCEPPQCVRCQSTDVRYFISYMDPDKPRRGPTWVREIATPFKTWYSCAGCLDMVVIELALPAIHEAVPPLVPAPGAA